MGNHQPQKTVLWSWEYADDEHPRPVEVQRLEALLNTVDHHRFGAHADKPTELRDQLTGVPQVTRWLVDHGLARPDQPVSDEDAARVREFRDGLRTFLEHRDANAPSAASWPSPNLRLQVRPAADLDGLELAPASAGVHAALERVVADAVVADAKGTLQRLKVCAAADCRFAYYDHSRSRTSRWCSMQTCGNRIKTRQYRHRRR